MMSVLRSLMCHGRIVILQRPLNLSSHHVLSVSYAINIAYRVQFSSKRVFIIISRSQPYMHPSNGLFMPNDPGLHRLHKRTLPIPRPPHRKIK